MKGFTLFEILLIISIIFFLAALVLPISLSFYSNQQMQANGQQILQTLRRAQVKAMAVEADSTFGVYFDNTNKKYILFKGNSYKEIGRDAQYDEVFELPKTIMISGLLEVVFSKLEGKPVPIGGDIALTSGGLIQVININEIGRINLGL